MYKNETNASLLAKLLLNYDYVMVDTCSLMEDSFPTFADNLEIAKKHYFLGSEPIYVLGSSVAELKRHKTNKDRIDKRIAAKRALRILRKSKWHKTITVLKEGKNQNFADQAILSKAMSDRTDYKILVITQDKKLADDLKGLNEQKAVHGKMLSVFKIDQKGELIPNKGEEFVRNPSKVNEQAQQKPKPQRGPSEQKGPSPHQTHRPDPNELNSKVVAADKRLRSIMGNTNYPTEKKIADAKALLSDLSRLSPETIAALHIFYTPEKIKEAIDGLQNPKPAQIEQRPQTPKQLPAPVAKKKDLWYEYGQTIESAFVNVANHYGVIFHDDNIAYVASVHGPVDFVKGDLSKIADLFGKELPLGTKIVRSFKGVNLQAERTQKGIKAWIDLNGVLTPTPVEAPSPKPKLEEALKPAPKKEEPAPTPKPQEANKPTKKTPKQSKKQEDSKQQEKPENPAKKEEKPAKAKQNKKANGSEKPSKPVAEKAKPKAKKQPKKEPEKKSEKPSEAPKKKEAKKEAPKAEPAKKQPAKKKEATKKEAPKEQPSKKPTILEETIQYDERLKANVNNPNYPKDQKIKDIQEQIERVKKVPVADRAKLNFSLDVLKTLLTVTK